MKELSLSPDIIALLGILLGTTLAAGRVWLKARLAPNQLALAGTLARTVVSAAEKVGAVAGVSGADKFDYAEQALVSLARKAGVRLDPASANALIHSALRELDNQEPRFTVDELVAMLNADDDQDASTPPPPVGNAPAPWPDGLASETS